MLFELPKRKEEDIYSIIKKSQECVAPKISLRGETLQDRINTIKNNIIKHEHLILDTDDAFIEYVDKALTKEYIAIDTETSGLTFKDQQKMVGLCIMAEGMLPAYVPVGHINNYTEELDKNQVSKECMKEQLLRLYNSNCKFIFHNYYFDSVVLYFQCGEIFPLYADTMLIACYLDENESHNLKDLHNKYVMNKEGEVDHFANLFTGIPFYYIPPAIGGNYAAYDAQMTMELFNFYAPFITKGTQECKEYRLDRISDLIFNLEQPLQPFLAEMKIRGIEFDFSRARELNEKYTKLRDDAQDKLYSLIDEPINYNSPKQVATLLYDKLKLKQVDGRKADADTLTRLDHPVAKAIVEVKTYDKLLGSFITKLTEEARLDGKIHCNFNSHGANSTGRMSSSSPK